VTTALDPAIAAFVDRIDPRPTGHLIDPVGWMRERLRGFWWSKQIEIAESVRDHPRTAVHSAHDLGKSKIGADIACWWVDSHPVGDALVVWTAPTYDQVHGILGEEIRKDHRTAGLQGKVTLSDFWTIGDVLVGQGRKPSDHNPHGFQGRHKRWVLAIIDEACGVAAQMWNAVEAITTNQDCRILAIGNPDDPNTEFEKVCRPGSGWNVIHLDGLESPNLTGEPVPEWLSPLLLDPAWVEDKKRRWGEDSPIYRSKARGLFSEDAKATVVPASWVARCRIGRDYHNRDLETRGQGVELGVDVGAGGDETVIAAKLGPLVKIVLRDRNPDTMRTTGLVVNAIRDLRPWRVKLDVIGIGKGVVDRLNEMKADGHPDLQDVTIVGVNVGERSSHPERFVNLRSQIWWDVARELSEHGGWDLSEIDDDTAAELVAPAYTFDSSGRIRVEPKDLTREKLGHSPDSADAVNLAAYSPASGETASLSTLPPSQGTVVRRGDLVLRGRQYIDRE